MRTGIRWQLLSTTALLILLVGGLALPLSLRVINHAFDHFEVRNGQQSAERVRLVLLGRMREMDRVAYNWGYWDSLSHFMHGQQRFLMANNFSAAGLDDLDIDAVHLFTTEGRLYASSRRTADGVSDTPDAEARAYLEAIQRAPRLQTMRHTPGRTGLLLESAGNWYFVGAASILNPRDQPPQSYGMLVFIQRLDARRRQELTDLAGLPFKLAPATGGDGHTTLQRGDIVTQVPLQDSAGHGTATLELRYPRPLLAEARTTSRVLALATIGTFLLGAVLLTWVVDRRLVRRLVRMDQALGELRAHRIGQLPVGTRGDEIDRLGQSINEYSIELTNARESWKHLAHHDPLTGLGNRASLLRAIDAGAGGALPWLLLIDLDGFKPVNDSLGHLAGDEVLRQVARRMRPLLPAQAEAFRLGGDEFAILLQQADHACALATAQALQAAICEPMRIEDASVRVTASIGMAQGRDGHPQTLATNLLRDADAALYRVKRSTRDGIAVHGQALPSGQ